MSATIVEICDRLIDEAKLINAETLSVSGAHSTGYGWEFRICSPEKWKSIQDEECDPSQNTGE